MATATFRARMQRHRQCVEDSTTSGQHLYQPRHSKGLTALAQLAGQQCIGFCIGYKINSNVNFRVRKVLHYQWTVFGNELGYILARLYVSFML